MDIVGQKSLPAGWDVVRADEIALPQKGAIVSGPFGSNIGKRFFVESGVPLIRGSNLSLGIKELVEDDYVFITEEKAFELRNCEAIVGDIVFTAAGTLGQVGRIPENSVFPRYIISNKQLRLRPNPAISDSKFLYYWFSSPRMQRHLQNQNTGASIPLISLSTLRSLPVNLPPLVIQRRISGVLSAYDELIENSQRRIKILESMARAIYREWFVHFRFPGHESVPRVPSALGEIPQGWEVRKLKDVCKLTMGQSPKSEYYNENGIGTSFHQGVTDFGDRFPSDRLYCTADGRTAEVGDILFSVRAPVGRMNIANKKIILGRGLSSIRHNDGFQAFLWEQLRNRFTRDDMMGNGSIFASVTKDEMQNIDLLCPPAAIVADRSQVFEALHEQIAVISAKVPVLRRTRDLLLPRLMSGQIDVEALS
jgi:type I restriction enzyme S subunit